MFRLLVVVLLVAGCSVSELPKQSATPPPKPADTMPISGMAGDLQIDKYRLLAERFARWEWKDGRLRKLNTETPRDCYYIGHLVSDGTATGRAAINNCAGDWTGVLFHQTGVFDLTEVDGRWVPTPSDIKEGDCGVAGLDPASVPAGQTYDTLTTRKNALLPETRFVEVLVFQDESKIDQGAAGPDPITVVHLAAAVFDGTPFSSRVLPVIVAAIDAPDNPWGSPGFLFGAARAGRLLDIFNEWLESEAGNLPRFDVAALLSGYEFSGSTVGYANVEGACSLDSAGLVLEGIGADGAIAQVFGHEVGHTLGMSHDGNGNSCANRGNVMTSVYDSSDLPTEFSTCSIESANTYLASPQSGCLDATSAPAAMEFCGDGVVQGAEECDCGPDGCAGRDDCCDGSTCRLAPGAACAGNDGCCDDTTCQPRAADSGFVCRSAASSCDVDEICDGSSQCPTDYIVPTGTVCTDDSEWEGACLLGECVTRGGICEALAPLYTFDDIPYHPMCGDIGCGNMECVNNGSCVVLTDFPSPDGTVCGDGMQCWQGSCVDSSTLDGASGCADENNDTDGDGTNDCDDECPNDSTKTAPGECGCGASPCTTNNEPGTNNANNLNNDGGNNANNVEPDQPVGDPDSNEPTDHVGEEGCATAGVHAVPSPWLGLLFVGVFGVLRDRRLRPKKA